ncbi:hypothetical protein F5Y15DRAFT_426606 [Xylariaceae sp. FL0016]|nr:hypothetical protein F5Y15DRAFT_426606 [Xylariaceae sp. FL0016]
MPQTTITNVNVFDGETRLPGPHTVVIEGSRVIRVSPTPASSTSEDAAAAESTDETGAEIVVVDGRGHTLLPGLIDAHVHIDSPARLARCAGYGVTAVCDMACARAARYAEMKATAAAGKGPPGSRLTPTAWRGTSVPAYAARSWHGTLHRLGGVGDENAVGGVEAVRDFVAARVGDGSAWVKVIADVPGLEPEVLHALAAEARARGVTSVAHVAAHASFARGLEAGFDVLTHVPIDRALDGAMAGAMHRAHTVAVPTLTMMRGFTRSWILWPVFWGRDYAHARESVRRMREAGVEICVGTDANESGVATVVAGRAVHEELGLLVEAGLTPAEALRGATSGPARVFGFEGEGRGWVREGGRADLVLVEGDPTVDIECSRRIKRVWSGGVEVEVAADLEGSDSWCSVM